MSTAETSSEGEWASLWKRAYRVLWLDSRPFERVEKDPRGLLPAALIVVAAGGSRGLYDLGAGTGPGFAASLAGAVVLWLLATGLLTSVGVRWLHGTTDFYEMLRTLGFAAVPLWLLAPASLLEGSAHTAAGVVAHLWAIAAAVVGVRQALNVELGRALVACVLALALAIGLLLLLGAPEAAV